MRIKTNTANKLQAAALLLAIFFIITAVQSYYYLSENVKGPSEEWARDTMVRGRIPHKVTPSMLLEDKKANILVADGKSFRNIIVDRETGNLTSNEVNVKGARTDIIAKQLWCKDYIFWTENYDLYYAVEERKGIYGEKALLAQGVRDFRILPGDITYLIAANDKGLLLFKAESGTVLQLGSVYDLPSAKGVGFVKANDNTLHIAAFSTKDDIYFRLAYLTYSNGYWELKSEVKPKSMSSKLWDIDIGLDDEHVYIFYQLSIIDSRTSQSEVNYAYFALNDAFPVMDFNKLVLFKDEVPMFTFVSSPQCIKNQSKKLELAVIKDTFDMREKTGYSLFKLTFDKGELESVIRMSKQKTWISRYDFSLVDGDQILCFLTPAGKFDSEVRYAENGMVYKSALSKYRSNDLAVALMAVVPGYVNGLFFVLIRALVFFPVALWFLAVELFNIKGTKKKPRLVFNIALAVYMLIKALTVSNYYTGFSTIVMPDILKFIGAPYFYAVFVAILAYMVSRCFKRIYTDMSNLVEFIVFMSADLLITTLIYTSYII